MGINHQSAPRHSKFSGPFPAAAEAHHAALEESQASLTGRFVLCDARYSTSLLARICLQKVAHAFVRNPRTPFL